MDQPIPNRATNESPARGPQRRGTAKRTTAGGVALALLVAAYSFGQPLLNERFGWNLPSLAQSKTSSIETAADSNRAGDPPITSAKATPAEQSATIEKAAKSPAGQTTKPGPLAGRVPKPSQQTTPSKDSTTTKPAAVTKTPPAPTRVEPVEKHPNLRYGILKDLGGERYVSVAGLLYTRGSAEGHRLDHLERHTEDDPSRPGKHGVFDGGMEGALATIDRAYQRAKTGTRTTKESDQGRTIYTVDMGSRVGYIGGRDGNRQKKPMARRVRIVLDQNRVITAYPL
jgi:hypothetical protein